MIFKVQPLLFVNTVFRFVVATQESFDDFLMAVFHSLCYFRVGILKELSGLPSKCSVQEISEGFDSGDLVVFVCASIGRNEYATGIPRPQA
jgi:hypothetical protein